MGIVDERAGQDHPKRLMARFRMLALVRRAGYSAPSQEPAAVTEHDLESEVIACLRGLTRVALSVFAKVSAAVLRVGLSLPSSRHSTALCWLAGWSAEVCFCRSAHLFVVSEHEVNGKGDFTAHPDT
ncbi:hypothetical protein MHPYR_90058 [uncultured Mycobacterium sp.]|uniref:Uncharacterized protein n=1 Tax=uncultured Mycobacterium sp. TaxID=171292 RepID=A0A1Y5PUX0_9MYCO|nr:hypothetical protein MHPYR_90058 [uncultured Mycobacterium sp.]